MVAHVYERTCAQVCCDVCNSTYNTTWKWLSLIYNSNSLVTIHADINFKT